MRRHAASLVPAEKASSKLSSRKQSRLIDALINAIQTVAPAAFVAKFGSNDNDDDDIRYEKLKC